MNEDQRKGLVIGILSVIIIALLGYVVFSRQSVTPETTQETVSPGTENPQMVTSPPAAPAPAGTVTPPAIPKIVSKSTAPSSWSTYVSTAHGYSINYPGSKYIAKENIGIDATAIYKKGEENSPPSYATVLVRYYANPQSLSADEIAFTIQDGLHIYSRLIFSGSPAVIVGVDKPEMIVVSRLTSAISISLGDIDVANTFKFLGTDEVGAWSLYQNKTWNFSFLVPTGWQITKGSDADVLRVTGENPAEAVFTGENCSVTVPANNAPVLTGEGWREESRSVVIEDKTFTARFLFLKSVLREMRIVDFPRASSYPEREKYASPGFSLLETSDAGALSNACMSDFNKILSTVSF